MKPDLGGPERDPEGVRHLAVGEPAKLAEQDNRALYISRAAMVRPRTGRREDSMTTAYDPKVTAVLCIDFYNDFLSEGGKLWPWSRTSQMKSGS